MRANDCDLDQLARLKTPPLSSLTAIGWAYVDPTVLNAMGMPSREDVESVEEWVQKFGAPPGPTRDWWLHAPCGLEFIVTHDIIPHAVQFAAEENAELGHLIAHLPIRLSATPLGPEPDEAERRAGKGGWVVSRQDDNGQYFEVESFSRETSARCLSRLLEARGHKQVYGVEAREPLPSLAPSEVAPFRWVLVRQDDNGHRFVVKRSRSRVQLDWYLDQFERLSPANKQTWFIEPFVSWPG